MQQFGSPRESQAKSHSAARLTGHFSALSGRIQSFSSCLLWHFKLLTHLQLMFYEPILNLASLSDMLLFDVLGGDSDQESGVPRRRFGP